MNAGDTVTINVAFPVEVAGSTLIISDLDGAGGTIPTNLTVGSDGSASFPFQVGATPGLYRVIVNAGGVLTQLQFQVPNPQ